MLLNGREDTRMADHYFSLPGGLTARFSTSCAIGREELLQLGAYVPGISIEEQATECSDITITHVISDAPFLEDNGNSVILHSPHSASIPADLYHLFYGVARREWIKRGFYPVHAACVGKGENFTLIVGHSGAGKTTLAQSLVDKHAMTLFSGNKTVVRFDAEGTITAVAGTKTMTALDDRLNRFAYEMPSDSYAHQPEAKIKSISIVRVNDGVEEEQGLCPLSALHTLYPYFMDAVNADVIVNGKDILDGTPTTDIKTRLTSDLCRAVTMLPVYKYSGSMNFLEQKGFQP